MIAKNEVLFEQYRIALKRYKDAIGIEGEDAINRNRLSSHYGKDRKSVVVASEL